MGAAASIGLHTAIKEASAEDLKAALSQLSGEGLAKLRASLEAPKEPAAPEPWKIEAIPDGGVLLCGHPGSGNVMTVMLFGLKHVKDKYKFQMCDIMKGEQMSPDFLAMNAFHQVPSAKMSDGTNLFESSAMLKYLAKKFAPETYPDEKQLLIDMCMDKRQTDVYKAWGAIGYYAMGIAAKPEVDAAKKLNGVLATMATVFLTGKFVGGDALTVADYSLSPLINTLSLPTVKKVGYNLPERWTKYLEDVKAELGDVFAEAAQAHEGWLASRLDGVEAIEFDADETPTAGTNAWKIDAIPDGGVLLCGHPGSGNVIAVMLFGLKHMKDNYKFQMCDIMKGEQMSPDFLAMNAFHQVPSAKMSDGTNLFESCAMLKYLAKKFAPETYPDDKQLLIDMCMDKRQTDVYKAWGAIGYYAMGIAGKPGTDAAKKLNGVLATMSTVFLTGKFVGGDTLTVADYSLSPLINTLSLPTVEKVGYTLPERWAKYIEDVKAELGDVFAEASQVHEGWLASKLDSVESVTFE